VVGLLGVGRRGGLIKESGRDGSGGGDDEGGADEAGSPEHGTDGGEPRARVRPCGGVQKIYPNLNL